MTLVLELFVGGHGQGCGTDILFIIFNFLWCFIRIFVHCPQSCHELSLSHWRLINSCSMKLPLVTGTLSVATHTLLSCGPVEQVCVLRPLKQKSRVPWELPILLGSSRLFFFSFLFFFLNVYFWETEREQGRDRERRRHRIRSRLQAVGSELSAHSPAWGLNSGTMRSWPEPKSDTNRLSAPRTPLGYFKMGLFLTFHWLYYPIQCFP